MENITITGQGKIDANGSLLIKSELSEYTPIPFWFWNDDLSETEIKRQIHDFNDKGVKGFVIHPRIGISKEIEPIPLM